MTVALGIPDRYAHGPNGTTRSAAEERGLVLSDRDRQPASDRAASIADAIRTRRSIRRYDGAPVGEDMLLRLIEAATWAPSPHNRQPWRFAVLTAPDAKRRLAAAMAAQLRSDLRRDGVSEVAIEADAGRSVARITGAPALILVALSLSQMDRYDDAPRQQAERIMAVQATAAAIQNILLTAPAHGLAAAWMCAPLFCPAVVKDAASLPDDWEPQALLTIGFPAKQPAARPRMPLADVVTWIA